ncbi:N-acetylmuramoyl-L-alanine amidase [Streptomyces cocklensis]|uniref:N-acetylmuramoyl-L-alanine amidase n=1 Tax=Actinacidiphila cocklensis TaxID=887465 RepID=A0A9W4E8S4_9ACTN|nr:N-acetylmuramoyl-L-alanine amidase [Actinacidiphila cocklensis]MDD1060384.1 N-acetylmuramoyl-L-alanine amidase [Actinacidiphila cocklensis]CAG6395729.1 N-acetylmuramoyl-L-alanine amidase [Actinacidiphila cocklensis]
MTSRHRRRKSWIAYGAGAVALATAATYGSIALASTSSGGTTDAKAGAAQSALQADFAAAAQEFQVPQSVLMAVSYRQTLWESHQGRPSTTGNYNVMGLTQVTDADIEQPTADEQLAHLNLSGDPAVTRHFNAARALKGADRAAKVDTADPRLHTLDAAAKLIDASASDVRSDPRQSVRAGAALLAQYEKAAVGSLPADPGRWWAGIARYSQSPDAGGAKQFVQRVYDTVKTGASRTTNDGQSLTLAADPSVAPVEPSKVPLAASTTTTPAATEATPTPECPSSLNCNFVQSLYSHAAGAAADDFVNHNVSNRPANGEDIRYIVIHDMEGTFQGSIDRFAKDTSVYASAHYMIADDGRVTQMVQLKDEAWHAANKTVNMHSVGVEHEGWAIKTGDWFTEQEYDSSAVLVKYLAQKFGITLDREHIIGHDEVPGVLDDKVAGQHWDPGPYWDWNHYMSLLGAPDGAGSAGGPLRTGQLVRVVPPYTTENQPALTNDGAAVAAHPANFVYLYTSPSTSAAVPVDPYLGSVKSTEGSNWADKVRAGGAYVVAGVQTDWTAIWYQGRALWFHNPGGQYTSVVSPTPVLTPASGKTTIPVYGRAYPEDAAYAGTNVPVQNSIDGLNSDPLKKYTVAAGQAYAQAGPEAVGDYWYAGTFAGTATGDRTLVKGTNLFYPIRYNHRIAWVRASDVQQTTSVAAVSGSTRFNLDARDASGALWQYQGTGNAASPYYARFRVGGGWQAFNTITDLNGLRADAVGDLVARDASGTLWYYKGSGKPSVPFLSKVKVGTGWSVYNMLVGAGDISADGRPDLIGRNSAGQLYVYKGTGTATAPFSSKSLLGTGWNAFNLLIGAGDVTGDGKADLVARDSSGVLWLYRNTGSATAPYAAKTRIGSGWGGFTALTGAGDITGDGKADLVARDSSGVLWLYKGTGSATAPYAAPAIRIGSGWNTYNTLL